MPDVFLGIQNLSQMASININAQKKCDEEYGQSEVAFVLNKYEEARQAREAKYDPIWDEAYRLYNNELDEAKTKSGKWRNRMFVPLSFSLIEDIHPNMMDAFFSQDDFLDVAPATQEDISGVDVVKMLMIYQLREKVKIFFKLFDAFKQAEMYGTSPVFLDFKKRIRKIRKLRVINKTINGNNIKFLEPERTESLEYNDPQWTVRDVYDIYPSPFSTREYQPYIIDRSFQPYDELKQDVEQDEETYNVDEFKKITNADFWSGENDTKNVRGNVFGISNQHSNVGKTNFIEKLTYWEDNRIITVAARKYKIRSHKENIFYHGKKPFIFFHYTPQLHEFYSKGAIEPVAPLQHDVNRLRNQRRDNVSLVLNKMWEVVASALEDENELVWQPGGIVHTNVPNMVREIPVSDVTQNSYIEEDINRSDMKWTHGITEQLKGIGGARKTASEAHELLVMAQSRLKLVILFNQKELQEGLKLHHSLNQQFLTKDYIVRVTGRRGFEFKKVSIFDIQGDYDFIFHVNTTALNQGVARQQFINMTQLFLQNPEAMKRVDWDNWIKKALRFYGFTDSDNMTLEMNKQEIIDAVMDQNREDATMMKGVKVKVSLEDNDDIHMKVMDFNMKTQNIFSDEELFPIFNEHYMQHKEQKIRKRALITQIQTQGAAALEGAGQVTEGNIMSAQGGKLGG